jgi:glycosyltransferase involved in cell wall biosynthesis
MSESHTRKKRGAVKTTLKNLFLKPLLSRMGAAMVTGTLAGRYIQSFGVPEEATFIVANTPDVAHLVKIGDELRAGRDAIRTEMNLADRRVVLFVGRLLKEKGVDTLMDAFASARKADDSLTLVIAGDGPRRADCEHLAASDAGADVRFLGFVQQDELPRLYAAADLFVLPSLVEPWGVVVNEAMAAALPVVLSEQVGAAADLVEEGANGFVIPAGDAGALAEKITDVLSDEERRKAMGERSREIIDGWDHAASAANFRAAVLKAVEPKEARS